LVASGVFAVATSAFGQAVLSSTDGFNTVYLGINPEGHLNVDTGPVVNSGPLGTGSVTGVAYDSAFIRATQAALGRPSGAVDATSPGCFCEGWGVSADTTLGVGVTNVSGHAARDVFNSGGIVNLTVGSFVHDDPGGPSPVGPHGTTATSTVSVTSLPGLGVTQAYSVAVPGALFQNRVTITNTTGGTLEDVRYVRVMDWDVPFTEFSEFVTIVGTGAANLEFSNDNGFASANPAAANPGSLVGGTTNVDFSDSGPFDHGAFFKFNFGTLADGASVTFDIFYGAGPTEASVLATLGSLVPGIELYSLGQSTGTSPAGGPIPIDTPTYVFAFRGVGGPPVVGVVPEPATVAVWSGLIGLGSVLAWRKRRQRQIAA
jgi:type IV pilus assembly protein PilY1